MELLIYLFSYMVSITLIFIIPIILNIIAYVFVYLDAKQKNLEPFLWLIVSIYSNFLGIIVYVFTQSKNKYQNIKKFYFIYLLFYICFMLIYTTAIFSFWVDILVNTHF